MKRPTSIHDPAFREQVEAIAARYPDRRSALLPMLHLAQDMEGYVSPQAMRLASAWLDVPLTQVSSVVSFYTMFRREPGGKIRIGVCRSLSCALNGGDDILHALEDMLGVQEGGTSADGRFSLETVECLAACDRAPCALVGERLYGPLRLNDLKPWLDELLASEPLTTAPAADSAKEGD